MSETDYPTEDPDRNQAAGNARPEGINPLGVDMDAELQQILDWTDRDRPTIRLAKRAVRVKELGENHQYMRLPGDSPLHPPW